MGSHNHYHGNNGMIPVMCVFIDPKNEHADDCDHSKNRRPCSSHASCSNHASGPVLDVSEDAIRRKGVLRRLYQASFLCACFIIVEVTGGLIAQSLAVLSDAAHLLTDLASFAVAIGASYLASKPATEEHTFGLKRTESLAALFSMVALACVSIGLGYKAVNRLIDPPEELVQGKIMTLIASIGVLVNIALAVVLGEDHVHMPGTNCHDHGDHDDPCHGHDHSLKQKHSLNQKLRRGYEMVPFHQKQSSDLEQGQEHKDHANYHEQDRNHRQGCCQRNGSSCQLELHAEEVPPQDASLADKRNINLRAAYLHVMADLAQSVAVLIAGLVIWARPDWHVIDPILTLLFAVLVLYSTVGVLRSSIGVLLEATPPNISWRKVYNAISTIPSVHDVHDLHLWSISHGQPALSVHCRSSDPHALRKIRDQCKAFGITHTTIQVQQEERPCVTCVDSCTSHLGQTVILGVAA